MTRDLKYCKVSVSVYDTDEQARKDTIATLNNASGHIGWELGKRMQIRAIPKFKFVLDEGIAYSVHKALKIRALDRALEQPLTEAAVDALRQVIAGGGNEAL